MVNIIFSNFAVPLRAGNTNLGPIIVNLAPSVVNDDPGGFFFANIDALGNYYRTVQHQLT